MDNIQILSIIWSLEFDIKCLMCGDGEKKNAKSIEALRNRIAELRKELK